MKWLLLNIKTNLFRIWEWIRVFFNYYPHLRFLMMDFLLGSQYFFISPYRIHKFFLKKMGNDDQFIYGETPLTTLDKIVRECRILSRDVIFDLGCGTGRTIFWLNAFTRCRAIGVDLSPAFIGKANWVKKRARLDSISFREEDILLTDLNEATAIYLYGICFEDAMISSLIERFVTLREGTKIISVSYPLIEYCDPSLFKVVKHFSARFPWGEAEVYLNVRS